MEKCFLDKNVTSLNRIISQNELGKSKMCYPYAMGQA